MRLSHTIILAALCTTVVAAPAFATVTVEYSGRAPFLLGSRIYFVGKLDGVGKSMKFSVNGIPGGNETVGTINSQNGEYHAPTTMPAGNAVTISATWAGDPPQSGSVTVPFVAASTTPPPPGTSPEIAACPVFPSNAVFNTRIDDLNRFPAHPRSSTWIASIGGTRALHMDFGRNVNQADYTTYYGIPYNVVDGTSTTTRWPAVSFAIVDPNSGNGAGVPAESDCATPDASHAITRSCGKLAAADRRFPYPNDSIVKAEYGSCNDPSQCGDRHVLVVEKNACRLWESYFTYKVNGQWHAYSTAAWDLRSNAMRPKTWTSADAAGLPILPLLMRADEASTGEIRHALRVTFRDSVLDKSFVWPATHAAGGPTAGGIPFGAVMRLRSDFAIPATWTAQARAIATAMKRYGVYVADIGSNAYLTGEPSANWSQDTIAQLQRIQMASFEFVDTRTITGNPNFNVNSYRASW
ncbi:hypothetical protein G4G28_12000 [Massilia sp. Dwa41.01b]|uniref:hypothetical protein n=1 Tax=unclassified Massilia TaxID=2609279 RepID=UPI0015FF0599|nr:MULTISPECIES: hypothetical protein [unclassified Massilia]QNA89021.1 hypothetical protein G4G28_12000 [Massilia sp. Dwa41.01b]QNA99909.1 hypothetical protein G4G31_15620 [Massilia sp. Se16.2.3]